MWPHLGLYQRFLGVHLDPHSSNHKNVSTRVFRAKEASKETLATLATWASSFQLEAPGLQVCGAVFLMYTMDSILLFPLTQFTVMHHSGRGTGEASLREAAELK